MDEIGKYIADSRLLVHKHSNPKVAGEVGTWIFLSDRFINVAQLESF
jgi:hypothetical protein